MGSEADSAQCLGGDTNMSFIHHAIAKKIKEDKDKDKLEPDDSPIKTVLGSLARNSLVSDTISVQNQNMNNPGPTHRRKRRRQWKPISIEDVPFRQETRQIDSQRQESNGQRQEIDFLHCGHGRPSHCHWFGSASSSQTVWSVSSSCR